MKPEVTLFQFVILSGAKDLCNLSVAPVPLTNYIDPSRRNLPLRMTNSNLF